MNDEVANQNPNDVSGGNGDAPAPPEAMEVDQTKGIQPNPSDPLPPPTTGKKRSFVWDHFTKTDHPKFAKAVCNYCGQTYAFHSKKTGTSILRMHLESQCKKYPNRLSKGQQLLSFEIKKEGGIMLKNHSFNVEECRKALAKFVIVDEMLFRVVEGEGFVEYSRTLEPRFTIPSKWTVARECMKLYDEEKEKLKGLIKDRRICLTTDCWTSIQNINYMCLTGHWIDDDWKLHKRILNFRQVTSHKGMVLGKEVELCLLD